MSFTVDNIVPPDQNFLGTSYGNLIPTWWNYIVALKTGTSPARFGMFLFLVGNVEGQDPPYPPQPKITVLKDVAVFFPTLCEVVSVSDHPDKNTEIKRREVLHDALQDPHLLKAEINGFELNGIGDFSKYYVESPEFELDVPQDPETLHSKFDPPMSPGSSRSVAGGYYLLLKPPDAATTYHISFEGIRAVDGYHTKASYDVEFV